MSFQAPYTHWPMCWIFKISARAGGSVTGALLTPPVSSERFAGHEAARAAARAQGESGRPVWSASGMKVTSPLSGIVFE